MTFTLSMPGIPTVSIDGTTGSDGKATFKTTVPKGADVGQGARRSWSRPRDYGSTQDYTVITIAK